MSKPATDEQISDWEKSGKVLYKRALIARIRAEQARAEALRAAAMIWKGLYLSADKRAQGLADALLQEEKQ